MSAAEQQAALGRVQAYLETHHFYRGGRSLASHSGTRLFLGDLRAVADLADARADAR